MLSCNISVNEVGTLFFAGQDTVALAKQYGTPLYLLDEDMIRSRCRIYKEAFRKHFGVGSKPIYASKANSFKRIYEIMREEGMAIDVVSPGELYTAIKAGFDAAEAYFHGNCKTDNDISYAMDSKVGYFVIDNFDELYAVEAAAAARGIVQKALLRLTPGIDPHTYEAISTGKVDSKFGVAIETGQAEDFLHQALKLPHIDICGFHCHVGSQVFWEDVFERTARVMLGFCAEMKIKHAFVTRQLDLGGGFGVPYDETDPCIDIDKKVSEVAAAISDTCKCLGIAQPDIHMEPGRSIIAEAGMTLYTVGSVKSIPGYKNYVAIDGGMTDNPRYALYGAKHSCLSAGHMNEEYDNTVSVVGRCCESGDIIRENIKLPSTVKRGDILAVCTTGAYNYSMASNYNRLCRPPVVMLRGGESYPAVRRESFEDLCCCEL